MKEIHSKNEKRKLKNAASFICSQFKTADIKIF